VTDRTAGALLIGLLTTNAVLGLHVKRSPEEPNNDDALKVTVSGVVVHVTFGVVGSELGSMTVVYPNTSAEDRAAAIKMCGRKRLIPDSKIFSN